MIVNRNCFYVKFIWAFFALVVLFIVQACFTPIHFGIFSSNPTPSDSLSIGTRTFNLVRRDLPEKSNIEIKLLNYRPRFNEVQFVAPKFLDGREIKATPRLTKFTLDSRLGRFVASEEGATFAMEGYFVDIKLDFLCFQRGGIVQIKRNSYVENIDLNCPSETWKSVILKSNLSYSHVSRFFFLRDQEVTLQKNLMPGERFLVETAGGSAILDTPETEILTFSTDKLQILLATANQFVDFLVLSSMIFVLLFISYSIGDWLAWKLQNKTYDMQEVLSKMVLGFFFLAVLSGTLSYFLSTSYQKYIVYLLVLVIFASKWKLGRLDFNVFTNYVSNKKLFLSLVLLSFYPILYYASRFLGQYHTDIYEYTTLADLLKQKSLFSLRGDFESLRSGVVTSGAGFEWRSIDSAFASLVSKVFFSPTRFGFVVSAIIFFILTGLILSEYLARKMNYSKSCETLVSLIAGTMIGIIFTYDEGYWSQYYFSCSVCIIIALLPNVFLQIKNRSYDFPLDILALIFTTSYALSVYPYFLIPVLAGVVLVFLRDIYQASISGLKYLAKLVIAVGLLSNLNLMTLVGFLDTKQFFESLDALAVGVVFTPYLDLKGFTMLTGVIPWHARLLYWSGFKEEFPFFNTYLESLYNFQHSAYAVTISIILIAVLLLRLLRMSMRSHEYNYATVVLRIVLSQVVVWSLFSLYYYFQDRPYVYFKSLLELSSLMPVFIIVLFGFTNKCGFLQKTFFSMIILIFFVFQLMGGTFDKISYLSDLKGRSSLSVHVGLIPTLKNVEQTIGSSLRNKNLFLAIGQEQLSGTDRDRVLLAHLRSTLRFNQSNCLNCSGIELPPTSIESIQENCSSVPSNIEAVISIGNSHLDCSNFKSTQIPHLQSSVFTKATK